MKRLAITLALVVAAALTLFIIPVLVAYGLGVPLT